MMHTRIKICGLTREEDLRFCEKSGIDFGGFIFHSPSPRYIPPRKAGELSGLSGGRVGVFVRQSAQEIIDTVHAADLDFIQLHGGQDVHFCRRLPSDRLIKVFWPEKYTSAEELQKDLESFSGICRYFLLDAGSQGGGHARTIQSTLVSKFIARKDTFLAGGLNPQKKHDSLLKKPFAVDVNSGVEKSPGVKDHNLIRELVRTVRG
jgi:phosphoribosylanthranilate isomerase